MFDIILSGGKIVDGSGKPAFRSDLGISGEKITCIGDLDDISSKTRIDVDNAIVAPGFIDMHTHSDFTLLVDSSAHSQVHQGVTLEAVGQCGHSCAPVGDPVKFKRSIVGYHPDVEISWRTFDEYLTKLEQKNLGINVVAFVGHGAIHRKVLDESLHPPTEEKIKEMEWELDSAIEEGAFGFSTGLEYWPGQLASPEELSRLCKVVGRHDVLYATHIRNRDIYYDFGLAEAISMARVGDVRLQISHIPLKYGAPEQAMEHMLEMIYWNRKAGVDVSFDAQSHNWSYTPVAASLPTWAFEGGLEKLLNRLKNPVEREKMKINHKPIWQLVPAGKWDRIVLSRSYHNRKLVGTTLEEIGRIRQINPHDAIFDLLLEEGENLMSLYWASHNFSEDDIRLCLQQPQCAVISDTLAVSPIGQLKDIIGAPHGYGWVARFFQKYVREEHLLSLEDAVRRVTSLPAERLGLRDRGYIRPGAKADITVFDPAAITDYSTISEPQKYPSGITHVIVNGKFALKNSECTNNNSGQVLRRI